MNAENRAMEKHKHGKLGAQIRKLFEERGMETYERVCEAILEEKIESQQVRDALRHFLSYKRTGFLVRPTLLSLGCEAVGSNSNAITHVAVPLVLMSGGIDIHDDIIDRSRTQGSLPTVFGKFDGDIALLAGDVLLFKGLILWNSMAEKSAGFSLMTNTLKEAFFELGNGEALEIGLRGRIDVEPDQYLQVVTKKAADVDMLLRLGAILGNGSKEEVAALGRYGRFLGMSWALCDDLADMFDYSEVVRRKNKVCLPLPVFYALKNPKATSHIRAVLSKKRLTQKDVEMILQMTIDAEGLEHVKKIVKDVAADAIKETEQFRNARKLMLLIQDSLEFISQI